MKYIKLITLALLAFNYVDAKRWNGLKVHGDHRILYPIVNPVLDNKMGITTDEVLNRVSKKLWSSGIRPGRPRLACHFLEVDVLLNPKRKGFIIDVSLKKMSQAYGYDPKVMGTIIKQAQGEYVKMGNSKGFRLFGFGSEPKERVLAALDEVLEDFIADYIDSNEDWYVAR